MRRFRFRITIILIIVILLGAAGIVALLHNLTSHALQSDSSGGGTLFLALVGLGLTAVVLGVAAVSRFLQSGPRGDGPRSRRG